MKRNYKVNAYRLRQSVENLGLPLLRPKLRPRQDGYLRLGFEQEKGFKNLDYDMLLYAGSGHVVRSNGRYVSFDVSSFAPLPAYTTVRRLFSLSVEL